MRIDCQDWDYIRETAQSELVLSTPDVVIADANDRLGLLVASYSFSATLVDAQQRLLVADIEVEVAPTAHETYRFLYSER